MRTSDLVIGFGLIILGALFIAENFNYIDLDFGEVWPVFVILGGIGFWAGFFQDRKNYGLIMPGTVLVIFGVMFFYCSVAGWYRMDYLWPWFIIGPGIGFALMYLLGQREKGLLIPAGILSGIGVLFLIGRSGFWRYWPLVLIVIGVVMILRNIKAKSEPTETG